MLQSPVCLRCYSRALVPKQAARTVEQSRFRAGRSSILYGESSNTFRIQTIRPRRSHFKFATISRSYSEDKRQIKRPLTYIPESKPLDSWDNTGEKFHKQSVKPVSRRKTSSLKKTADGELTQRQIDDLHTELKWLKDPVRLGEHIRYLLEKDDEEKAIALCRLSTKAKANIVSWNHVLDYQMKRGKPNVAFSTFNEMKKRSLAPDGHTYTVLLRGLADFAHHPNSLGKALSLYHGIFLRNSRIAPTIYHVNAIIKVCARANDMDSMWDIASKLPERGPHAADSITFTTILNYLRINALNEKDEGPMSEEKFHQIEEVIIKGKQLWNVVIARWKEGELLIDEELVGAMGRLLLAGNRPKDWDNVFSLVQQTMNIPRLEPRLGTLERSKAGSPTILAPFTPDSSKDDLKELQIGSINGSREVTFDNIDAAIPDQTQLNSLKGKRNTAAEVSLNLDNVPEDAAFDVLDVKVPDQPKAVSPARGRIGRGLLAYTKPGNVTLSLLLETCLRCLLKITASAYWELLTNSNSYAIEPDQHSVNMMLRIHQRSGDSSRAIKLLEEFTPRMNHRISGRTFQVAMAACKKNFDKVKGLEDARKVFSLMQRTLPEPHVGTTTIYVQTARSYAHDNHDREAFKSILDQVWESIISLRTMATFSSSGRPQSFHTAEDGPNSFSPQKTTLEIRDLFTTYMNSLKDLLHPDSHVTDTWSSTWGPKSRWTDRYTSLEAFVREMSVQTAQENTQSASQDSEEPSPAGFAPTKRPLRFRKVGSEKEGRAFANLRLSNTKAV